MDADLQDPPAVVVQMLQGYCRGYEVVYGQRLTRQDDSWSKRLTARLFYWLMRTFIDKRLPSNVGDFRLISRRVVDDLKRMPERDRFLRGMVAWVGYAQLAQPYDRPRRAAGETKYPFWKMVKFALTAITAFSDMPLRLVSWIGLASIGLAFFLIVRVLFLYFFTNTPLVLGYPSLVIMIAFFSGLILMAIGVVGLYVGKIFSESQRRPLYLVRSAKNVDGPSGT
jgi:dolichol-phosphate mannosyltransferase